MAGSVQDKESQKTSLISAGADLFNSYCRACHRNGGNMISLMEQPKKGGR
jgi:mono/diheme cytochrome c family protein